MGVLPTVPLVLFERGRCGGVGESRISSCQSHSGTGPEGQCARGREGYPGKSFWGCRWVEGRSGLKAHQGIGDGFQKRKGRAAMDVVFLGNPILRRQCRGVSDVEDPQVRSVVERLKSTLYWIRENQGKGRGIAAPQVGSDLRVVFIDSGETDPLTMINPEITSFSEETFDNWEGCLSIPPLRVQVRRHSSVTVRYLTEVGEEEHLEAEGVLAGIVQHEVDHLDGILTLDRAQGTNAVYLKEEWERQFGEPGPAGEPPASS